MTEHFYTSVTNT